MIRSVFLDIDGTLVSFATHQIPQSAVDALAKAKANGVGIFISTGRPLPIINNLGAISHLIDGYITTNGAMGIVGGKAIFSTPIPQDDVDALMADCKANDYACIVAGERNVVLMNPKEIFNEVFVGQLNVTNIDTKLPVAALNGQCILQFSPFISEEHEQKLMSRMPHCVSGRWHTAFTDITSKKADKGNGLEKMAAFLGLDLSETMALGDGGNDIPIIKRAGIGVAMGNAGREAKEVADFITTSVDDNGIRNALLHFGIIK